LHTEIVALSYLFVTDRRVERWSLIAGWLLIAVALAMCIRGTHDAAVHNARDFSNISAGADCLVEHCHPYDTADLSRVLEQHGYVGFRKGKWINNLPIYPPPTLALLTPLATVPFQTAATVFYIVTLLACLLCGIAVFVRSPLLADVDPWVRGLCLAAFLAAPKTNWAMAYGNPVVLTTALLLFCCFDVAPSRGWLRAALFALACILKPQLAVPMAIVFLIKRVDGWRMLVRAAAIGIAFTAATLAWCASNPATASWLTGLKANLALGASAGQTMSPADHTYMFDTLLNLQYMIGYLLPQPGIQKLLALVLLAGLAAGLLLSLWRIRAGAPRQLLLLAFAATAALTLLPVYHRFYDAILLTAALPWATEALHLRRHVTAAAAVLALLAVSYVTWVRHLPVSLRGKDGVPAPTSALGFVTHRFESMVAFAVATILIVTFLRATAAWRATGSVPTERLQQPSFTDQ
jgi:hypothetical protein